MTSAWFWQLPTLLAIVTTIVLYGRGRVALRARWTDGDRPVRLAGYRLPGYTGGKGFYFSDGDDYLLVRSDEKLRLTTWQPVLLEGRWREDSWGGGWLLATAITELD